MGCHWSCSALDGTGRPPRACRRQPRDPACLLGPRWVRPACVGGAHTRSASSLGSPRLRDRGHKWGVCDGWMQVCVDFGKESIHDWKSLRTWRQDVILVGLSNHCVLDYTHHVWGDVDECKGLAGRGNEVEPSLALNRLVSQRCFCTGTKHILQMHRYRWKKAFAHLNGAKLLVSCTGFTMSNAISTKFLVLSFFYLSVFKAKPANCEEDYCPQEMNTKLLQA